MSQQTQQIDLQGTGSTEREIDRDYSTLSMPESVSVSFSYKYCSGNERSTIFNFFESSVRRRQREVLVCDRL